MAKANLGPKIVREHQPFIKVKAGANRETTHYSVFYEGIPEKFKQVAEEELNETEESRRECLERLKEAAKGELVEDALLLAFLRNQKFNVNKAAAKLKKFIAKRREIAKMLAEMDLDKIEAIIDDMGVGVLPYRDQHGRLIIFTRPDGINLDVYTLKDVGIIMLCLGYLATAKYPLTTIAGSVYFGDCAGADSFQFYYEVCKTMTFYSSTLFSLPLRIPRIEVLNAMSYAKWILKVLSKILSTKIFGRISLHENGFGELHEHFSRDILPDCFGGTMGPLSNDVYRKKLLDFIKEIRKEYS